MKWAFSSGALGSAHWERTCVFRTGFPISHQTHPVVSEQERGAGQRPEGQSHLVEATSRW